MGAEQLPTRYSLASSDPRSELIQREDLSATDLEQIDSIMANMGRLRAVERKLSLASQHYMKLNATDMRALRILIAAKHQDKLTTPGQLANELGISTASVTKMLDRLERAGHITRTPHPTDRRSQAVQITPHAHVEARQQVGRHHATRFEAARRLSPAEREVVIRFLSETARDLEASIDASSAPSSRPA